MSALADAVLLSRSGLSRLVTRLEDQGLIERAECADDARGSFAAITEQGRRRLDEARVTHRAGVRERFFQTPRRARYAQPGQGLGAHPRRASSAVTPRGVCADRPARFDLAGGREIGQTAIAGAAVRVAVGGVRGQHVRHLARVRRVPADRDPRAARRAGRRCRRWPRRGWRWARLVAVPLGPWVEFRRKRPVMIAMDLIRFAALLSVPPRSRSAGSASPSSLVVSVVVARGRHRLQGGERRVPEGARAAGGPARRERRGSSPRPGPPPRSGRRSAAPRSGCSARWRPWSPTRSATCSRRWASARSAAASRARRAPDAARLRAGDLLDGWRLHPRPPGAAPAVLQHRPRQRPDHGDRAAAGRADARPTSGSRPGSTASPSRRPASAASSARGWPAGSSPGSGSTAVLLTAGALRACWPVGLAFVRPGAAGLVLVIAVEFGLVTCMGVFNPVLATYRLEHTAHGPRRPHAVRLVGHEQRHHRGPDRRSGACWPRATGPRTAIAVAGRPAAGDPAAAPPARAR